MASSTWWTCVWASSGSWWWTGKSGMLQSTGSQRVGHDWATELNFHGYTEHVLKTGNSSHSLLKLTLWFSTIMKNLSTLSEWSFVHYTKCYSQKLQPRQRMCSSVLWPLFQTLGSYSIRGSVLSHNYSVDWLLSMRQRAHPRLLILLRHTFQRVSKFSVHTLSSSL